MEYVGIEGMPKLVDEITPEGVPELLEDLSPWDLDLAIMMVESHDRRQRGRLSFILDDLLRMHRGYCAVLLAGKPVPVYEYRQIDSRGLAEVIKKFARGVSYRVHGVYLDHDWVVSYVPETEHNFPTIKSLLEHDNAESFDWGPGFFAEYMAVPDEPRAFALRVVFWRRFVQCILVLPRGASLRAATTTASED